MEIKVEKGIYSKQVLLKTAYSFTGKAYLHLCQDDNNWIVQWRDMPEQQVKPEMFENELIAQQLREELLEKTKGVRMLLLSRALASSVMEMDPSMADDGDAASDDAVDDTEENAAAILKGWFDV